MSAECHSFVVTLFTRLGSGLISSPETTHNGHAHDIAKDLATNYDAVVTVSGDGLVHEVLNGFAEHADPLKAFTIPVAPIPTGSGNGLSLNLLGVQVSPHDLHCNRITMALSLRQHGFDVTRAALNVIKGVLVLISRLNVQLVLPQDSQ